MFGQHVSIMTLKEDICTIIQYCTDQAKHYKFTHTLVLGDINLEFKRLSNFEKNLLDIDLAQLISTPTHRLGSHLTSASQTGI